MTAAPAAADSVASRSPEDTLEAGARLAAREPACRAFYLEGDLGAGKTVFAKGLARHYGVDPRQVTSPTFALVSRYGEGARPVYHLDLYRIERPEELRELGIEEMEEEDAVVIVEWPERLGPYRRADAARVRLVREANGARRIEIRVGAEGR
ncbi:MAG: tRNA (adenosine(37)-N6)-threonylcarbamoyltransferase complex ATPase subunit type 1 TsaE [Acidobacteriota bacterium]|nr:tRNA (adenosine(37)-N6)-threonylcarbamoyltransferase complex ATPase subunit type 1 TsaE [Acidobacteriota bacterium]